MRLALHIGAHKTATTHLQRQLKRNRDLLRDAQVACLLPKELRRKTGARLPPFNDTAPEVAGLVRREAAGAGRLLLSEENILGSAHNREFFRTQTFYPRGIARLSHLLEAFEAKQAEIFMAIRDPAGFFASAYSQRLLTGRLTTFEAFLEGADVLSMRWSDLLAQIAGLDRVGRLVVWPFEVYAKITQEVLGQMTGIPAGRFRIEDARVHEGLTARAVQQVLEWVEADATPPARGFAKEARDLFPRSAGHAPFQPWSQADMAQSQANYLRDVAKIAAHPGIDWIGPTPGP